MDDYQKAVAHEQAMVRAFEQYRDGTLCKCGWQKKAGGKQCQECDTNEKLFGHKWHLPLVRR